MIFLMARRGGIADRWPRFRTLGGIAVRLLKMNLWAPHFRASSPLVFEAAVELAGRGRSPLDAGSASVLADVSQ
jgi:hypothetical protein